MYFMEYLLEIISYVTQIPTTRWPPVRHKYVTLTHSGGYIYMYLLYDLTLF